MRIRGLCQKKALKILVDTGSTHNLLSSKMAKRINCELIQVDSRAVEVAKGQKCSSFEWEMQGSTFQTEVYIINLETYDLILGGEWLSTLGEIRWREKRLSCKGNCGLPKLSSCIACMFSISKKVMRMKGKLAN